MSSFCRRKIDTRASTLIPNKILGGELPATPSGSTLYKCNMHFCIMPVDGKFNILYRGNTSIWVLATMLFA